MPQTVSSKKTQNTLSFLLFDWLLLAGLMLIFFFWQLGSYPLFDLDEPRYAEAAREMLENNNWITPYFNYELRFDKPVLFYWLIAKAYQWFGVSEFSARFFSAVTASSTVFALYYFAKYWIDRRYGLITGVVLMSCLLFLGLARMSITDMTLSCWMTLTILCLFMVPNHHQRWWILAGLFSGLAVLTKGPVGVVLPGSILCLYSLLTGSFKRSLLTPWFLAGLLICAMVSVPWYVLAYQQNGQIFIDALFTHNVTRFSDVVSGHKQPFYFYAVVLLVGSLPWAAYLPAVCQRIKNILCKDTANKPSQVLQYFAAFKSPSMRDQLVIYAWVWALFVFVFFSISHTKLLTYILPMFPALALGFSDVFHFLLSSKNNQADAKMQSMWKTIQFGSLFWVIATVIAGGFFILKMDLLLPREAAGIQGNQYNVFAALFMLTGAMAAAWFAFQRKVLHLISSHVVSLILVLVVAGIGILPVVSQVTQGAMLHYLQLASSSPLMIYEIQRPSLTFYGQRRIERFVKRDTEQMQSYLLAQLAKHNTVFVITKNKYVTRLSEQLPAPCIIRTVEMNHDYRLLSISVSQS